MTIVQKAYNLLAKLRILENVNENQKEFEFREAEEEMQVIMALPSSSTETPEVCAVEDKYKTIYDIYIENNMENLDNSIFKVKEFNETLPEELPEDTKIKTLQGILDTANLSLDFLKNDGKKRIEILKNAEESLEERLQQKIAENKQKLLNLSDEMVKIRQLISDDKNFMEAQCKKINKEIDSIDELLDIVENIK